MARSIASRLNINQYFLHMASKNRNKLLRKININNNIFFWCVVDCNHDGEGSSKLKIFKNKLLIFNDIVKQKVITPKKIREIILTNK